MKKNDNNAITINNLGQNLVVHGWVQTYRNFGKVVFIDLRDYSGIVQVIATKEQVPHLSKEFILEVEGKVQKRTTANVQLASGEIEILATKITILTTTKRELPLQIDDNKPVHEKIRLKYRYLDLRRNKMKQNLILRHKLNQGFRTFLENDGHLEIETPILSKSTPEGANDFLVEYQDKMFFALPQSPQIYKQLAMAAGVEKYYQIARAFRNENLRSDRQLEFTQLDIECAFTSEEIIIDKIERMFNYVLGTFKIAIPKTFPRIAYDTAISTYGSDRPDNRFENHLFDVDKYFAKDARVFFKNAESIRAVHLNQTLSNNQIKELVEQGKKNKADNVYVISFDHDKRKGKLWETLGNELRTIAAAYEITSGTLFIVANTYETASQALGAIRVEFGKMFHLYDDKELSFLWVVEFPLFELNDEQELRAAHHPFTMPKLQDMPLFSAGKDLLKIRARAYDLVLNGLELGGGSIRINDLATQKQMFRILGLTEEQIQTKFGFFLEAFEYGLPPHGGIAFGIDRIAMILAHEKSIKEVIAFPKNSLGYGPLEDIPTSLD